MLGGFRITSSLASCNGFLGWALSLATRVGSKFALRRLLVRACIHRELDVGFDRYLSHHGLTQYVGQARIDAALRPVLWSKHANSIDQNFATSSLFGWLVLLMLVIGSTQVMLMFVLE